MSFAPPAGASGVNASAVLDDDNAPFEFDALHVQSDPALQRFFQSLAGLLAHGRQEVLLLSSMGHERKIDEAMLKEAQQVVVQPSQSQPQPQQQQDSSHQHLSTPQAQSHPLQQRSAPPSTTAPNQYNNARQQPITPLVPVAQPLSAQQHQAQQRSRLQHAPIAVAVAVASAASAAATVARGGREKRTLSDAPPPMQQPTFQASPPSPCTLLVTNLAVYVMPPAIPMPRTPEQQPNANSNNDTRPHTKYFLVNTQYTRYALQDILLLSLPYRTGVTVHGSDYALRINDFALHCKEKRQVWLQSKPGQRSMLCEIISDAYEQLCGGGHRLPMVQPDYAQLVESMLTRTIWQQIREMQMQWWASGSWRKQGWLIHKIIRVDQNGESHVEGGEDTGSVSQPQGSKLLGKINEEPRRSSANGLASHLNASSSSTSNRNLTPRRSKLAQQANRAAANNKRRSHVGGWRMRWFLLTSDLYLLHFASPQEMDAFRAVTLAAMSTVVVNNNIGSSGATYTSQKFLPNYDCNQIDLTRARVRLGVLDNRRGFEIIVFERGGSISSTDVPPALQQQNDNELSSAERRVSLPMRGGYTRHLFTVPPPPPRNKPQISTVPQPQQSISDPPLSSSSAASTTLLNPPLSSTSSMQRATSSGGQTATSSVPPSPSSAAYASDASVDYIDASTTPRNAMLQQQSNTSSANALSPHSRADTTQNDSPSSSSQMTRRSVPAPTPTNLFPTSNVADITPMTVITERVYVYPTNHPFSRLRFSQSAISYVDREVQSWVDLLQHAIQIVPLQGVGGGAPNSPSSAGVSSTPNLSASHSPSISQANSTVPSLALHDTSRQSNATSANNDSNTSPPPRATRSPSIDDASTGHGLWAGGRLIDQAIAQQQESSARAAKQAAAAAAAAVSATATAASTTDARKSGLTVAVASPHNSLLSAHQISPATALSTSGSSASSAALSRQATSPPLALLQQQQHAAAVQQQKPLKPDSWLTGLSGSSAAAARPINIQNNNNNNSNASGGGGGVRSNPNLALSASHASSVRNASSPSLARSDTGLLARTSALLHDLILPDGGSAQDAHQRLVMPVRLFEESEEQRDAPPLSQSHQQHHSQQHQQQQQQQQQQQSQQPQPQQKPPQQSLVSKQQVRQSVNSASSPLSHQPLSRQSSSQSIASNTSSNSADPSSNRNMFALASPNSKTHQQRHSAMQFHPQHVARSASPHHASSQSFSYSNANQSNGVLRSPPLNGSSGSTMQVRIDSPTQQQFSLTHSHNSPSDAASVAALALSPASRPSPATPTVLLSPTQHPQLPLMQEHQRRKSSVNSQSARPSISQSQSAATLFAQLPHQQFR